MVNFTESGLPMIRLVRRPRLRNMPMVKNWQMVFWNNGNLTEVDYSNNTIAEVTTWDNSKTLVVRDRP